MVNLKSNVLKKYLDIIPNAIIVVGADWCPHCNVLMDKIKDLEDKDCGYQFLYIDGDKFGDVADELHIEKYPTMIKYINGKEVKRKTGSNINKFIK